MKLFLDDYRNPQDCIGYMGRRIKSQSAVYADTDWTVVRNFHSFVRYIELRGLPELISFDHDLADAHYHESMYQGGKVYMKYLETTTEKTGYDCAKWLVEYCISNSAKLPKYFVHSMNPVGTENIQSLLDNFQNRGNSL